MKLDLTKEFVAVGPYQIQGTKVFGLPEAADKDEDPGFLRFMRGRLKFIAHELGLVIDEAKSGTQQGYGHGRETMTLANQDGSLVFQISHINHCDGPGYSCSYSHGPWFKYGSYTGNTEGNPDLLAAIAAKERLRELFQF